MTVKKRKLNSQKVSNSKHKTVKKGISLRSVHTKAPRTGKTRSRSNSKLNSNIKTTKDSNSSEQNIISQESVDLPFEEEEEDEEEEVDETDIFFDTMQQRLSQSSNDGVLNDDVSSFEEEEENENHQDPSDSEESGRKSELLIRDEVPDVFEEDKEEEINLKGSPRQQQDTSVVSSITQSTKRYGKTTRNRTYDDLLIMIQEKDKTIKQLSSQINGDEFYEVEFSCSQEKTVIETTKKFIFPCQQFLRNQDVLNDFSSRGSIGKVLMDKLDIPSCQRQAFWFTYKNSVRKGIKQQRCIAHNALKEKFLGK